MPEFEIALNVGLRRKEQYQRIGWSGVDFLRRDLFVPPSKNGYSRHISLNAAALVAFKELFARRGGEGPIFAAERGGDRLLGARHWFEDAIAEAKVPEFTWHSLRHTFASRLVMAGVDLRTVAELMGHKKIQMTMRYAHLAPAHTRAAVDKLAAYNAIEQARQSQQPAAILISGSVERTDTITDTGVETDSGMASANVQ